MTDSELQAIAQRAEKATEGPWEADGGYVWRAEGEQACCGRGVPITDHTGDIIVGEQCCGQPIVNWQQVEVAHAGDRDAVFIAHARQDIPALLAEITRLRAEIDEALMLTECFSSLKDMVNGVVEMQAEITRLRAQVEAMRVALEPFAKAALILDYRCNDDVAIECALYENEQPTVGDLRRASQANGSEG